MSPLHFGVEPTPDADLNQFFGFRPRLVEQSQGALPAASHSTDDDDGQPYKVLAAPVVSSAEKDDYKRIADILRAACRENRQPVWDLEIHWSEFLLYSARAWPILFGLALGYSLLIPIGLAIFFSSARPDPGGFAWFVGVWTMLVALLVGYTAGFWMCVLASAFHGEAGVIRWPGGEILLVARSLALFLGCFLAGPALLVALAIWYWINAGELTPLDHLILTELYVVAGCWWIFTYVAVIKGHSMRAATPTAVLQLARKVGPAAIAIAIILMLLMLVQVPWLLAAISLLHENAFVGWFSLLSCFFCMLFAITFLMRWLGVQHYRSCQPPAPSPRRLAPAR